MEKLIIKGGRPLHGNVRVSSAKNAVLPIIVATLLPDSPSTIIDAPHLEDVKTICSVIESLGGNILLRDNAMIFDTTTVDKTEASYELMSRMRASFLIMGPLLAKKRHAKIALPGGCMIGSRPIDLHLKAFEAMGAKVTVGNGYVWGTGSQSTVSGLYESAEANPFLTWETVLKANIGFDLSMWNGLLGVEFDVYRDLRRDKIIIPTDDFPTEYGIKPSQYNAGKEERYGVDLTVSNHTKINRDFSIDNSFVFGFSRDKQIDIAESMGTYSIPRFRRTGKSASQLRGYIAEGLFANQEEIDNWAYQSASTRPGDIKYRDINGDGKIDNEDETIIGRTRVPEIMYGYTLSAKYKGFDFSLFLQGTGHSDFYIGQDASGASDRGVRFPFKNDKPRKDHIHSWTTDNPDPNAKYPRLSTIEGMNYVSSSFWVVNTAYLKLKSLEIGYNFEQRLLKKLHVDNLRVYLNFYNLWTIYSDMPKDFDVENQNYNAYPQQFVTSLGVNITF